MLKAGTSQRLEQGALLNGRYAIQEVVGRGGMGTVYRALDTRLDLSVAVKEMTERDGTAEEREAGIRQFEREAKMLGQLQHSNLPRVTDYFVEEDHWYLIMEFVVGETLDAKLRTAEGAPLPLSEVLDWAVQIADVLAYLHGQSPPIVFRDIKPANIMIQADGMVKLIDFGIARRFTEGATKDTLLYGSPGYSPPEQYGRAQTDPRSDIYALGATLHHLISGRDPAPTPFKFPSLRSLMPGLPANLDSFVARCVEMDEEKRIQTAEEARDALVHVRTAHLLAQRAPASAAAVRAGPGGPSGAGRSPKPVAPRVVSSRVQRAQDRALVRRLILFGAGAIILAALGAAAYKRLPRSAGNVAVPTPATIKAVEAPVSPLQSPREPTTGSAHLTSTPTGVVVLVDGKEAGKTPLEVMNLAPGKHTLRFLPPDGSGTVEASREVEIAAGKRLEMDTALQAAPAAGGDQPAALLNHVTAQAVAGNTPDHSGVRVSLDLRVTGAAGKQLMLGVFFYGADGKPLQPARGVSGFQSRDGQLAVFASPHTDAEPADFPDLSTFVPLSAFPQDITYDRVLYRVEVFLDDKMIQQTDLIPLARPGA